MTVLEFVRSEDPEFKDVPDADIIKFLVQTEPEFLKDKPFQSSARSLFGQEANAADSRELLRSELDAERNPFLGTAFGRGITRGVGKAASSIASFIDAGYALNPNSKPEADQGIGFSRVAPGLRDLASGAEQIPYEGPQSIRDIHSVGDALAFGIEQGVSEQIPQLAAGIATGGAFTSIGLAPKAAGILGAILTTFPQETGGAFEEILQRTGKKAPLTAAASGAINAFLETFGDSKLIERALGGDAIVGRTVKEIVAKLAGRTVKQGAKEAGVEAAQELVTALAPVTHGAQLDPNLGERLGTAAALGAVGGATFSGGIDTAQLLNDFGTAGASTDFTRARDEVLRKREEFPIPGRTEQPNTDLIEQPIPFRRIPSQFDTPIIDPGITLPATPASVALATRGMEEVNRVSQMTREQRVANDLLQRIDLERQQSAAEAQALDEQGLPEAANLRFAQGLSSRLDAMLVLGQLRTQPTAILAPEPDTDLGLGEAVPETIAPSLIDTQILAQRFATEGPAGGVVAPLAPTPEPITVPNIPPVKPGFVRMYHGGADPRGKLNGSRSITQYPDYAAGYAAKNDYPVWYVDVPENSPFMYKGFEEFEGGPKAPWNNTTAPADVMQAAKLYQSPQNTPEPAAPTPGTQRQSTDRFSIKWTPERLSALEVLNQTPAEEQAIAEDPNSTPATDEGKVIQQFLHAGTITTQMAQDRGVELDAEATATLERVYQQNVLDQYIKAKAEGKPFNKAFSQKNAFRDALSRARRMRNTAGTLKGRVLSTETELETGETITNPAVTEQQMKDFSQQNPATEEQTSESTRILDFLDAFTGNQNKAAATNLLADFLNIPRPIVEDSKAREALEADPAFRRQVEAFAKTVNPTRQSLSELNQEPLLETDVQGFAQEVIGDLSQVEIVNDGSLVDENGNGIRAQYRPGNPQPFLLNAAFLGSQQDVREALLEELLHGVWSDTEVQQAWEGVKAEVTEEDLAGVSSYPQEQQLEEAAVRRVIRESESPATQNWIQKIVDAIKRLFGVTTSKGNVQKILSRALLARSESTGDSKNSQAKGYWKNLKEAQKDAANAGDPQTILAAAEAQGYAVPKAISDEIANLGTTGEEGAAAKLLQPISSAAEMGLALANTVPIGPDTMLLANAVNIPTRGEDIANEAVLKQGEVFQGLKREIEAEKNDASERLSDALGKQPQAQLYQNRADLYQGVADQFAGDYQQYLIDLRRTTGDALDPAVEAEINAASRRVTSEFQGLGNSIAGGFRSIAKEIPASELASIQQTQAWIAQRLNDPNQPRLMSDAARDWLLQPIGRQKSPLMRDPRLNKRLENIKDIASDKASALANIAAFEKALTGKKVTPKQFATKWADLREKYKESLAAVKEINAEIKRLDDKFNGAQIAEKIVDKLLSDPHYQNLTKNAIDSLHAGNTLRTYEGDSGHFQGLISYNNPLTDKPVFINLQPDLKEEIENIKKIEQLLKDVDQWAGTTTDLLTKAAWNREAQWLNRFAYNPAKGVTTGTFLGGFRLPSLFQINPFSRSLGGFVEARGPGYDRIGNRLIQGARQTSVLAGVVERALRKITQDFEWRIANTSAKAMESHGRSAKAQEILKWWVPNVLDPILSQHQNPTGKPYKVGDTISEGIVVTKEDMDAIKALKDRDVATYNLLEKSSKDSPVGLLYYHPLQIEEEFNGRPLSRRAIDYGFKMARRPLSGTYERGRIFTEAWLKTAESGDERKDLLAKNYDWVLMSNGLIGNTDKDFDAQLTKEDAALFDQIRSMQRSGTLPFHDLDGLIRYAGQRLAVAPQTEVQAAEEFRIRLIRDYVDRFVRAYNTGIKIVPKAVEKRFNKLGLPSGITESVGVGQSPFLTPRGRLLAPPSFYSYSTVDARQWGALMTSIKSVLTLREIESVGSALAAIQEELKKYHDENNGLLVQLRQQNKQGPILKRLNPFMAPKRQVARSTRKAANAGQLMVAYQELVDNERTLSRTLDGLKRIATEHVTRPEDNAAISTWRALRSHVTSALLQSVLSVANNAGGGKVAMSLYLRQHGGWQFITEPVEAVARDARYLADNTISKMLKIKGVDPAMKKLAATPGFKRLAQAIVFEGMRFEQERARAIATHVVDPPEAADKAKMAQQFPETAGRLTDEEPNIFMELLNRLYSMTPGLARTLQTSKAAFPGAIDRMINQGMLANAKKLSESIGWATRKAWEARDDGTPGWDNLALPSNRFKATDVGQPSETIVNSWRQMLSSIGSLESLALDHYNREKASGKQEPFLNEGQILQLVNELARQTNMGDPANTPLISQGRGVSGEARKTLMMLLRWPINFAGVNENIAGRVYGDNTTQAKQWRMITTMVALLMALAATSLYKEMGQEARQAITGDPRTAVSIAQVMNDPSAGDLVRYGATSLTSVMPFIGERISQAFGGTSNKPLLDATRMFAPLGIAYDLEQTAIKILQSGDLVYPLADLTRRYAPMSGAVINRLMPGEMEAREASRGIRLASPSDIELRPQGGGTTSRQTPLTPIMRTAVDLAMAGDEEGSRKALDQAVQYRVSQGQTEAEARSAVSAAFQSRDPERTVFGRELKADERRRILARMSSSQRRSYDRARDVFSRPVFGGSRSRGRSRSRSLLARVRRRRRQGSTAKRRGL